MNSENKSISLLFNPSVYIAGAPALLLGLGSILLAGLIGWISHTHFDGVLDTHMGTPAPIWVFLLEGILDWLSMGVVLLVLGRLISRTAFRTLDVLGTQALARWPMLLVALVLLPKALHQFSNDLVEQLRLGGIPKNNLADMSLFVVALMAMLVFVCWSLELMYKAFSVSCNVKGGKAAGTFFGGVLLAEILSKVCIMLVFQHVLVNNTIPSAAGSAFVDLLAKKDFDAAEMQFDSTMKSALPEARLRGVWEQLLGTAGSYQKQTQTRTERQAGYDVALVTCQFEHKQIVIKVVFDSKKRVAGLWCLPPNK